MPTLNFHIHRARLSKRKRNKALDQVMLVFSLLYPLSGVPQITEVWTGSGKASLVTWLAFTLGSFLGLAYGLVHRLKPLIFSNVLWTFVNFAVIIGILRS